MRFSIVLLLMFYTSLSFAGNVISYEVSGVPNVVGNQQVFYIEGHRLKQKVTAHLYYIYDSSEDSLHLVDTNKRAYYPLSRTFFKDVSKTVSAQEQRIKDMLLKENSKLTEQTRATLQQALNSMQVLRQSAALLEKKNNLNVKIDGPTGQTRYKNIECNTYQVATGNSKADVCYANFKQVGLSQEVVKTFNKFQRFLSYISGYNSLFAVLDNHLPINVAIQKPISGTISFSGAPNVPMAKDLFDLPVDFLRMNVKNPSPNLSR